MPEFLGRPNLPNSLANSLVQLAAQQENPIATGIKTLGNLAEQSGDAYVKSQDEQKKFAQQKELKQMEIDAQMNEHRTHFLTELVKNDQVVESLLKSKPMSSTDADAMMGPNNYTTPNLVKADFGSAPDSTPNPAAQGGIPSEKLGLGSGFSIKPKVSQAKDAGRYVKVDPALSGKYPALKGLEGKEISTAQYVNLQRASESASRYKGNMEDKLWARAVALANNDMDYIQASMEGNEAKIADIIEKKKRLVMKTGGREGSGPAGARKPLGSIIADAFEKGIQ